MHSKIEKIAASAADLHAVRCKGGKAAKKRLWQLIYEVVVATLFAERELMRRRTPAPSAN